MSQIANPHCDIKMKLIVLGDSGAGKTCLLNRYDKNEFTNISKTAILHSHGALNVNDADVSITLIGNMCDIESERKITYEEGKQLATKYGAHFIETSVIRNINIQECMIDLIIQCFQRKCYILNESTIKPVQLDILKKQGKNNSDCAK
ncbi:hypothetical protein WA158_000221 [Blastocystis sp. Blastoise]